MNGGGSWNHSENESSLSEARWKDLAVLDYNILTILTRVDSALKGFMAEEKITLTSSIRCRILGNRMRSPPQPPSRFRLYSVSFRQEVS